MYRPDVSSIDESEESVEGAEEAQQKAYGLEEVT